MMATTNGIVSPVKQSASDSLPLQSFKRKRDSAEPDLSSKPANSALYAPRDVQKQVTDYVEVLKSYDVYTNILSRPLSSKDQPEEPNAKRKRGESRNDTISGGATSGLYSSMGNVFADIKDVCSSMLEQLKSNANVEATANHKDKITSEKISQIKRFTKVAEELLQQEQARELSRASGVPSKASTDSIAYMNGKSTVQAKATPDDKIALSLYGNAPGPRQLFSSLQKPVKTKQGTEVTPILREAGLPTGINATVVVPIESTSSTGSKKPAPTMGELFGSSSATIPVPKPSRIGTTRGDVVGWYQPSSLEHPRSRAGQSYFSQQVTCGQWLDYSGPTKRKPKARSMSLASLGTNDALESESDKLDALFKNAYSSFAPSRDDTAALIPEATLNRIWWQKTGMKNFQRLINGNENDTNEEEPSLVMDLDSPEDLEELMNGVEDIAVDPALEDQPTKSIEEKESEEVLNEISDLLETLNSYQRNRNLTLPSSRPGEQTTASKPDELEIATYNTLKAQLTFMISMLPPFAVAKLNSDQLSELNISTKIPVLKDNYRGTMEEDEDSQRPRVPDLAAASRSRPAVSPSTQRPSSTSLYGNQYSSTPRPAAQAPSQYYSSMTPVRPPSNNSQRPPATAPQQYATRPPSGPPYRQPSAGYPATPTYPHQIPRPPMPQYGAGGAQYYQNSPAQTYNHQSNYGGAPMTAPQGARYPQTNGQYQPRPQPPSAVNYNYTNGSPAPRQPSPQKPQYSPQQSSAQPPRPYGTPTPGMPNQRYYGAGLANGTPTPSTQPPQQAVGASGFHTVMTASEQSTMMERQRAQLAQQQGTQHQARSAAQAGAINGPSQVNGGNGVTTG